MNKAQEIMQGFEQAQGDRKIIESTWEDVVYYTNPRKRGINVHIEPGEKPPYDVFDGTAPQANVVLAAGLAGFLTNASQRWFELKPRNPEFIDNSDEKVWFAEATNRMFAILGESNFYHQVHEMYLDFGPFGTGVFYSEEDPKEHVRFYARHPKETFLIENEREMVDKVYRSFEWTAYASYKFFGAENVPKEIKECVEVKNDFTKKFKFIHYVCPRDVYDPSKSDSLNKPFASYWMSELLRDKILKEGGYDEFPYFAPRFYKNSCEVYGYGPGHTVYPDIRMINDMTKTYYESAEVALYPPQMMEHDSIVGSLDLRKAAINYQKQPLSRGLAVQAMSNGANFQIGLDFINRVEDKVQAAFFVDLFLSLRQTKRMTATEVIEASQERLFLLGPVLGRLQSEFLTPMLSRVFNILLRRGAFPEPPASLQGVIDYDVVYVSPLARAQRSMQVRDMRAFAGAMGEVSAIAPQIMDNFNADEYARELHEMHSVSPKVINGKEVVEEIRAQRAQAQEQAMKQENMMRMAELAKTAGSATKDFASAEKK